MENLKGTFFAMSILKLKKKGNRLFFPLEFTDFVLPHFLQFVHWELLLLQTVKHDVAQAGELAEWVGESPQPLVDDLAEGEEPIGHRRPPLPQGDLEQSSDDPGRVLKQNKQTQRSWFPCSCICSASYKCIFFIISWFSHQNVLLSIQNVHVSTDSPQLNSQAFSLAPTLVQLLAANQDDQAQ